MSYYETGHGVVYFGESQEADRWIEENIDGVERTSGAKVYPHTKTEVHPGVLRYLDQVDYNLIAANPKPFIGYSDITALQCAMMVHADLLTFSGPMVAIEMGDPNGFDPYAEETYWRLLSNALAGQILKNPPEKPWQVYSSGKCFRTDANR